MNQYLAEITAYVAGAPTTLYFSTKGCVVGDIYYEPRIVNAGSLKMMMFADGTTMGKSTVGYGEITLINNDGGLDYLITAGFSGRLIVIKELVDNVTTTLMVAIMDQPTFSSMSTMSIRLKDSTATTDVPIQSIKYDGSNILPDGIEGTSDIAGKPKPLLFGACSNVTPVLVNTSKLIYQLNAGPLSNIVNVYDKGVALVEGSPYSSLADMYTNAPIPGQYRSYLAGGLFRLGSPAYGIVTSDALGSSISAELTVARIFRAIVTRSLPEASIVLSDLDALEVLNPSPVGIYINTETTINAVLTELMSSIGAWYGFNSEGLLTVGRLDAPSGTPVFTLTEVEILLLDRLTTQDEGRGLPSWRVITNYDKNYTLQDASSLAASVEINGSGAIQGIGSGNGTLIDNALAIEAAATAAGVAIEEAIAAVELLPGQSAVKGLSFLRSIAAPTTPIGGSYSSPTATGWSDGIPVDNNQPLWMVTRLFTNDGLSPQQAVWTAPVKIGTPSTGAKVQFSTDLSSWHDAPAINDLYMRSGTSTDNGATWIYSGSIRIKGETGASGENGVTTYTWIKYSDVADGTGLYDTPTAATKYIGIAVNKTVASESAVKTDYVWSLFKGDTGATGSQGPAGPGLGRASTAPVSPVDNQVWFNTGIEQTINTIPCKPNTQYIYNGTTEHWELAGPVGSNINSSGGYIGDLTADQIKTGMLTFIDGDKKWRQLTIMVNPDGTVSTDSISSSYITVSRQEVGRYSIILNDTTKIIMGAVTVNATSSYAFDGYIVEVYQSQTFRYMLTVLIYTSSVSGGTIYKDNHDALFFFNGQFTV